MANASIAPREWRSSEHVWIIDAVMPFEFDEALLPEIVKSIGSGKVVNAWLPDAAGQLALRQIKA